MKETIELKEHFNAKPSVIFQAWLNGEEHSKMTGGKAKCTAQVGDSFSAWDGYISGKNLEIVENVKIVQSWRTTQFDDNDEDSILTITFSKFGKGTEITLYHTNIPEGQLHYKQGWIDHYFNPMKAYFD